MKLNYLISHLNNICIDILRVFANKSTDYHIFSKSHPHCTLLCKTFCEQQYFPLTWFLLIYNGRQYQSTLAELKDHWSVWERAACLHVSSTKTITYVLLTLLWTAKCEQFEMYIPARNHPYILLSNLKQSLSSFKQRWEVYHSEDCKIRLFCLFFIWEIKTIIITPKISLDNFILLWLMPIWTWS